MNWSVQPTLTEELVPVIAMAVKLAVLSMVKPLIIVFGSVAVMATVPVAMVAVASPPLAPGPLVMVTTLGLDELQLTVVVIFCMLLSLNVPVAVNCRFCPA